MMHADATALDHFSAAFDEIALPAAPADVVLACGPVGAEERAFARNAVAALRQGQHRQAPPEARRWAIRSYARAQHITAQSRRRDGEDALWLRLEQRWDALLK